MVFTQSANWTLARLTGSMGRWFAASSWWRYCRRCSDVAANPRRQPLDQNPHQRNPATSVPILRTPLTCPERTLTAHRPSNPIHGNRGQIMTRLTTRLSLPLTTGPSRTTGRSDAISETKSPATLPAQRPRSSSGLRASGASTRTRSEQLPFGNHIGT